MKIGDSASISKTISDADVRAFADTVGDTNPLHLDDEFAKSTRFGRRIAHGFLGAALISAVLGTRLPGKGTIYLSQSLQFKKPIYPGQTITARVTVKEVREDKPIVTLQTECLNELDETVITGEAVVLLESKS